MVKKYLIPGLTLMLITAITYAVTNTTPITNEVQTSPSTITKNTITETSSPDSAPNTISYDSLRIMAYSGKSDEAIKLAMQYLKTNKNLSIQVLLARMLIWNKQYDAAKEHLLFVLSKNPRDYDAYEALADIEVLKNNYGGAIEIINNSLKYRPNDESLIEKREIIRAKMYLSFKQRDKAIQVANDYLKTHDTNAMRVFLGNQLTAIKQYDKARNQFNHVLKNRRSYTDASIGLADLEITLGNYQAANKVIDEALIYNPKNSALLRDKAMVFRKLNPGKALPPELASINISATAGTPTTNTTYDTLEKMARSGERKKAIQQAEEYLKQNDNSDVRILLGLMLSWNGQYEAARKQFQIVLEKKPDSLDASRGLANVEMWSKHNDQAIIVINNALKYNPKDKILLAQKQKALGKSSGPTNEITYEKIKALAKNNQRGKAIELANEYLKKNENADIRVLLGIMYSWDSDYDHARQHLQTVLNKKPNYMDATLGLINVEIWTSHYNEALDLVNKALKSHPGDKTLLEKRTKIIQDINQALGAPGVFSLFGVPSAVGPYAPGKKMNAIIYNQEVSYVDDLKQTWETSSLGYERYTPYGPIIFTTDIIERFRAPGEQYLVEAYPRLFKGAYMYLGYGNSNTSYIAQNYYGFEPFFSLPYGFEVSGGERILQFQGGVTYLYTASIAKYIGNYWIALRSYLSNSHSRSYYLTARRYFSTPESYISLTLGAGSGPSTIDLLDPDSISSDKSTTVRLNGKVPISDTLYFTWLAQYSNDHFPNGNIRRETDVVTGLIYLF